MGINSKSFSTLLLNGKMVSDILLTTCANRIKCFSPLLIMEQYLPQWKDGEWYLLTTCANRIKCFSPFTYNGQYLPQWKDGEWYLLTTCANRIKCFSPLLHNGTVFTSMERWWVILTNYLCKIGSKAFLHLQIILTIGKIIFYWAD